MHKTCVDCGGERFSYYKCNSLNDCLPNEICTKGGFCCPLTVIPMTTSSTSNLNFEFVGFPTLKQESEKYSTTCPDGSSWLRECVIDSDCKSGEEVCAEGKCCAACSYRRRRVLNDLPTNDILGVHIPQCDQSGRYYRPTQCRIATEECWCVSEFGKVIGSLKPKTVNLKEACEALRLAVKQAEEERQKLYRKIWEGTDLRRKQENFTSVRESNEALVKESKNLHTKSLQLEKVLIELAQKCLWAKRGQCPNKPELAQQVEVSSIFCHCDSDCSENRKCCPDSTGQRLICSPITNTNFTSTKVICAENEEYVNCLDACQPTCTFRSPTPCPLEECNGGCHCKPGFIREGNELHTPCIPRTHCPQQVIQSELKNCTDPLREYTRCGPACPISCSSLTEKCVAEGCVQGCFCKIPYILENGADPIHSRCILPAYCPLTLKAYASKINDTQQFTTISPSPKSRKIQFHIFPTNETITMQCTDPLKNFQSCGSGCPVGCNNRIAGFCGTQCVAGCFCRKPYILQDAYNMNSRCILPHQCQSFIFQQQVCSDPRKQWTHCFSNKCVRSCSNLETICTPHNDCSPGCLCREPYVLSDASDLNSRCVLPSECGSQCNDSLKEYHACASSCPMGLVFEDAVNWRTSKCITLNQCPVVNSSVTAVAFTQKTIITTDTVECPTTTIDLSGKVCSVDSDCPIQQRCCHSTLFAFVSSKQSRCTCTDPHAYWDPCGSLCPEYCGQPAVPVCSTTCNPSCRCAPEKYRDDVSKYRRTTKAYNQYNNLKDIATVKMLLSGEGEIAGDIKIKEINSDMIKLEGMIGGMNCIAY
ncbi:unnamed protein product [Thelazia callipaeda]|uniref:Thyroglobulin type-1 domain-containing protein n=1 Tax=Thelazia callipaeda TaxID=103827 RepID=A0A0N5DC37_THECL|nr:unnamed protein product [Thelazia callipaeda]